jgi:zinc protease
MTASAAAVCFWIFASLATAPPPSPAPAPSIPFEKYTLPQNGLEVILSRDPTLPLAAVSIWYHAGPINEAKGRTGFAHLFEHLMFQGSGHVGDDQHFKLLESRGASLVNATTGFDRTNFIETVPSNELELALWLESDRMGFLLDALTQKNLDNQREVVKNERRQSVENAPYGPSDEALTHLTFPSDHPYYGNVIGSMDDLTAASLDDVRDFYTRYYAPANATLVIVGDFDPATVKNWIAHYFGSLPPREKPAPVKIATPPITSERRQEVPEPVSLPQLSYAYLSPLAFAPGDAAADVLATVLGGGKASRMHKRLVYELQWAQGVGVGQQSGALASVFAVQVTASPGANVISLEHEVDALLLAAAQAPPTEAELQRAKNLIRTNMVRQLQGIGGFNGRAEALNRYNQYLGDPAYFDADLQRYAQVTGAEVQQAAQNILNPAARAVVVTVPKK